MSIEDRIRASLTDDRHALPAWPDATDRVHRGVRRRRRQRAVAIAFAVVLVLGVPVAVTAYATRSASVTLPGGSPSPTSTGSSDESAVPWVDAPATYTPGSTAPAPTARPCTAADLSTTAGVAGQHLGISQEDAANVMVKNISGSRCTLSGTPVLVTTAGGGYQRVPAGNGSFPVGAVVTPASINPQQDAYVQLAKTLACNGGTGPTQIARQLALTVGGAHIPIPGLRLSGTCPGVFVSPWFTWEPQPVSAFAALSGSIDVGPTAVRGQPLRYVVELTNTSDIPVPLDPCPVYFESIAKDFHTYRLNCAPGSIGPRQTVRFSMVLDLPADLPVGAAVVTWRIVDVDFEAEAEAQVQVTD
jgi:hypothetical protein